MHVTDATYEQWDKVAREYEAWYTTKVGFPHTKGEGVAWALTYQAAAQYARGIADSLKPKLPDVDWAKVQYGGHLPSNELIRLAAMIQRGEAEVVMVVEKALTPKSGS